MSDPQIDIHFPSDIVDMIRDCPFENLVDAWADVVSFYGKAGQRELCRIDRFYLLTHVLGRVDAFDPWLHARCREVEANPDGHLDLWAREHYKSTIITFAGAIQEIIRDPDITICIFSHTKGIAKKFFVQVKEELERNLRLQDIFPDIFWEDTRKASRWSEEKGLVVKRKSNAKEATLEAHGLVDGQPTSAHYRLRIYDDVVTRESVSTPEQIAKTTSAWELSDNLGARQEDGGAGRAWHIGTRYHFADSYHEIMGRGVCKVRIHPATDTGLPDGMPVFLSRAAWDEKKKTQGPATIACHCAGTTVLMADWTYKTIEDVRVGDMVVGYELGGKTKLVPTEVVATNVRKAEAMRYTLASGKTTECTPGHKWWAQRSGQDGHNVYAQLGTGKKSDLKRLYRVARDHNNEDDPRWQYLAGLLDGEGTVSGNRIVITQSKAHNPEVHARIIETLNALGIDYSTYEREAHESHGKKSKGSTLFLINGGRHVRHRILLNARPAKKRAIIDSLFCSIGGKTSAEEDMVVARESLGERDVYNIQTVTGNYIANGYASKNCQMLQNPAAGTEAMFQQDHLRFIDIRPNTVNIYILCDPASSKKKGSDSTAISVLAIDAQRNKILIDGYRHKMNLQERWAAISGLRRHWMRQPGVQMVRVGYERYGMRSDIEYFEEKMLQSQDAFEIVELAWPNDGTAAKYDRIQRLYPDFSYGKFHLIESVDGETSNQKRMRESGQSYRILKPVKRRDHDGNIYALNKVFLDEYLVYPFSIHDDVLDASSRIYDMDYQPPIIIDERHLEPEVFEDGI